MTDTILNRADIARIIGKDPATGLIDQKLILGFESLQKTAIGAAVQTALNVEATTALQDATVVTLSPNATLTRERILAVATDQLSITDNGPGDTVVLGLVYPVKFTVAYSLAFNLLGDTSLDLPTTGRVPSSADGPYANDAAAAAADIPLDGIYRGPAGLVTWRQV